MHFGGNTPILETPRLTFIITDPLFLFKCQADQADDADGDAEAHAADVPGMTSEKCLG